MTDIGAENKIHTEVIEKVGESAERIREKEKDLNEKDVVRRSLEEVSGVSSPGPSASVTTATPQKNPYVPGYLNNASSDPQVVAEVTKLVKIALQGNIQKALKEAQSKGPFVIDAVHDALVDELLPVLKKRGYVKGGD